MNPAYTSLDVDSANVRTLETVRRSPRDEFNAALVRHFAHLHCAHECAIVGGDWEGARALEPSIDVARHYLWDIRGSL